MKNHIRLGLVGLLVLAAAVGAYLWWQGHKNPPQSAEVPSTIVMPMAQPIVPTAAEMPRILHPIEPEQAMGESPEKLPVLDSSDAQIERALVSLLGRKAVLTFLNLDGFVRRCVATVDNLARGHAASRVWPVVPTPQRFLVTENNQAIVIDERNADRYKPFVKFAVAIDPAAVSSVYRRLYPLFQKAHEELGYPGQYFNDRLVVVIDQLLETPLPTQPVQLTQTKIQGPYATPNPHPWYEFADADLERRPAGQKILIRMGPANATQLQSWLVAFRSHIATKNASK